MHAVYPVRFQLQIEPSRNPPHLSAEVEVQLSNEQRVTRARGSWGPGAVGGSNVRRPIKGPKVVMRGLAITRREGVGKRLCAHAVDASDKAAVSNGGVAGLGVACCSGA